jgi:hypothetical protein
VRRAFDDFSSQRNFAASLCRGKWALVLDADDYFESLGDLRRAMEQATDDVSRVQCIERTVDENGVEIETGTTVVAYRRDRCAWKYRGHNSLLGDDRARIQSTAVMVYRHPWNEDGKAHARRTLPLLMRDFADDPKDAHAPFFLARCHYMLDNWAAVEKWASLCIELEPKSTNYASAWFLLANAVGFIRGGEAKRQVVELAIQAHPRSPDVLDLYQQQIAMRWRWECMAEDNPYQHSQQTRKLAGRFAEIARAHGWVVAKDDAA